MWSTSLKCVPKREKNFECLLQEKNSHKSSMERRPLKDIQRRADVLRVFQGTKEKNGDQFLRSQYILRLFGVIGVLYTKN